MLRTDSFLGLLGTLLGLLFLLCSLVEAYPEGPEEANQIRNGRSASALFGLMKEVMARASTTSEVLTLNMTNLFILLVIKGILLALGVAGRFGFGLFPGRRSTGADYSGEPILKSADLRWALTYFITSQDNDYECLNLLACLDPDNARDYTTAGKFMIKGAKMVHGMVPKLFPFKKQKQYKLLVEHLQDAASFNGICEEKYRKCNLNLF